MGMPRPRPDSGERKRRDGQAVSVYEVAKSEVDGSWGHFDTDHGEGAEEDNNRSKGEMPDPKPKPIQTPGRKTNQKKCGKQKRDTCGCRKRKRRRGTIFGGNLNDETLTIS